MKYNFFVDTKHFKIIYRHGVWIPTFYHVNIIMGVHTHRDTHKFDKNIENINIKRQRGSYSCEVEAGGEARHREALSLPVRG